jgi:hypothetical protein
VDAVRQYHAHRRRVAAELVRHQATWTFPLPHKHFAQESFRCSCIPTTLHQDIENLADLIHCSPQVVMPAPDLDEDLVDVPSVAEAALPALERAAVAGAELQAPAANGLVRHLDPALGQEIFNVAETQAESGV